MRKTSNGNVYIHLDYQNADRDAISSALSASNIKNIYRHNLKSFKSTIKQNFSVPDVKDIFEFLDTVKSDTQRAMTEADVTKGIHTSGEKLKIKKSVFDKDIESYIVKEVETSIANLGNFQTRGVYDLTKQIDGSLYNLNSYISTIDKILDDIDVHFNDRVIQKFVEQFFLFSESDIDKTSGFITTSSVFNEALTSFLNNHTGETLAVSQTKTAKNANDFLRYATRLKAFRETLRRYEDKDSLSSKDVRFIQGAAYNIGKLVSQVGGFLLEPIIADAITSAQNGILEMLEAVTAGSKTAEVTGVNKANKKLLKRNKVTNTSDVNLIYKANGDSIEASVNIQLPGASLKAFSPKKGEDYQTLSIQTGTTLKEIFLRINAYNTEYEYAVANVLSSYGGGQGVKRTDLQGAYNYITAANTINALVGTMQKTDTSYFFIANNKVFTTKEILEGLVEDSKLFKLGIDLEPGQTTIRKQNVLSEQGAESRSENLLQVIRGAKAHSTLQIQSQLFFK